MGGLARAWNVDEEEEENGQAEELMRPAEEFVTKWLE
jgi:hypothetical protein